MLSHFSFCGSVTWKILYCISQLFVDAILHNVQLQNSVAYDNKYFINFAYKSEGWPLVYWTLLGLAYILILGSL